MPSSQEQSSDPPKSIFELDLPPEDRDTLRKIAEQLSPDQAVALLSITSHLHTVLEKRSARHLADAQLEAHKGKYSSPEQVAFHQGQTAGVSYIARHAELEIDSLRNFLVPPEKDLQ